LSAFSPPESQTRYSISDELLSTDDRKGFRQMSEEAGWDELTRFEQRALIKLFGGGTLRREDPAVVHALRARGFVDEYDALSMPGLLVLTLAMRRQQVEVRSRM
jgi:hypothetical protein